MRLVVMERHTDLGQRAVLDTNALTWMPSPMAGSSHAPFREPGSTILVKLRQMHPLDQQRVVIDTSRQP